jgi:hypothetical protein
MATKDDRAAFIARAKATATPQEARDLVDAEGMALGDSANWHGACTFLVARYDVVTTDESRTKAVLLGLEMLEAANI